MLLNDKEPKRGLIELFLTHALPKKKVDISTSAADKFLQITESDETACYSTNDLSDYPSQFSSSSAAVGTTKISSIFLDINCFSKEPPPSRRHDQRPKRLRKSQFGFDSISVYKQGLIHFRHLEG
jgi:hypothetical protein